SEALRAEFFTTFWQFVRDAGYEGFVGGEAPRNFYRFKRRRVQEYPWMIELFTRNALNLPAGVHLTPVPAHEDLPSLSAILLEDDYYRFVVVSRITTDGVSTTPAGCLIPLKARAWLDLTRRKAAGEAQVKDEDLKKHRNDVFRLLVTLAPADRVDLPDTVRTHLTEFLAQFPPTNRDWESIQQAVNQGPLTMPEPEAAILQLRTIFRLG
ncbi:MAG: hypothetical protein ACREIC_34115, partial [Limisphaerales bacterium]